MRIECRGRCICMAKGGGGEDVNLIIGRLAGIGLMLGSVALVSWPASSRGLEDELVDLVKYHPQVEAARKTVRSSGEEIDQARAGYLPQVSATGEIGPTVIDNPVTRARQANVKDQTRTKNIVGMTVTQNVFDGFATSSQTQTARLNREVSEITLNNTTQTVMFEGITAYIDVLRQKRLVDLS